jgi:nitrate/nitrite transport system substrate-binding protein
MTIEMSSRHTIGACTCGRHHAADDMPDPIETALLTGLFPNPRSRRRFLRAIGAGAALAALETMLPVAALKAMAQDRVVPEKPALAVGFLPITCATPLIMAEHLGLYAKQGLAVSLVKVPGITLIRDKLLNGELDASEQVMPVPISVTMGSGSIADPTSVLTIQNQNGNSLVLAMKHKNNRDPRN